MAADWFYAVNGQEAGPVELQTLQQMVASGTVATSDYVRGPSHPQWTAAGQVASLMPQNAAGNSGAAAQTAYAPDPSMLAYRGVETGATGLSQAALTSLSQTKPWVRFIAVMIFIGSGLMVFAGIMMTVAGAAMGGRGGGTAAMGAIAAVYIVMAVIYIIPGVFLNRFANGLGSLMRTQRMSDVELAFAAQKAFWKTIGIMIIAVISLYVVGIVIMIVVKARF